VQVELLGASSRLRPSTGLNAFPDGKTTEQEEGIASDHEKWKIGSPEENLTVRYGMVQKTMRFR
jgi:hypothetical protein